MVAMLLRFAFSNFLSIRDRQELLLTASSLRDQPPYLLSVDGQHPRVVPIAGTYGANASGKTNILLGLHYLVDAVLNSHANRPPTGGTPVRPFRLDEHSPTDPSRFDIDFMLDGVRYHFGFAETQEAVIEEWLFAYPRGRKQEWYYRNSVSGPMSFGNFMSGRNRTIEELTRPNSLFLSTAAQNNHEQLSPIFHFFKQKFVFLLDDRGTIIDSPRLAGVLTGDAERQRKLISFLTQADIGIKDLKVEDIDTPEEMSGFMSDLNDLFMKRFPEMSEILAQPMNRKRVMFGHNTSDGNIVYFDVGQESRGTRELLGLLSPIFDAVQSGKILVVDELDSSLHPLLSIKVLEMFSSGSTNPGYGQLLFTTHDTNLLSCGAIRRDEIWFTEKDRTGSTHLYPLTDIRTRNTDNLQRGYMQGRYGAIPYLGDIDALFRGGRDSKGGT